MSSRRNPIKRKCQSPLDEPTTKRTKSESPDFLTPEKIDQVILSTLDVWLVRDLTHIILTYHNPKVFVAAEIPSDVNLDSLTWITHETGALVVRSGSRAYRLFNPMAQWSPRIMCSEALNKGTFLPPPDVYDPTYSSMKWVWHDDIDISHHDELDAKGYTNQRVDRATKEVYIRALPSNQTLYLALLIEKKIVPVQEFHVRSSEEIHGWADWDKVKKQGLVILRCSSFLLFVEIHYENGVVSSMHSMCPFPASEGQLQLLLNVSWIKRVEYFKMIRSMHTQDGMKVMSIRF